MSTIFSILVLAYVQDCSFCIYYSTTPAFLGLEAEINLPCDDALWNSQTSAEWYKLQRTPSRYGTGLSRMLGVNMEFALASLKDRDTPTLPYIVSPFSSFILIHSILRDVVWNSTRTIRGPNPHTAAIQFSLHNWQKMWSANPETIQDSHAIPFVSNAIHFYWLAKLAESAKQSGSIDMGPPPAPTNDIENRYRLVKTWLTQISSYLRISGSHIPPNLWNNPTAIGLSTFSDIPSGSL